MKVVLILLVMAVVSFLAKADDVQDKEIMIREPINTVRYISGAE
jgi:hypothetical protein